MNYMEAENMTHEIIELIGIKQCNSFQSVQWQDIGPFMSKELK